ncbi:MAG: hypothetical protein KVP17_003883, partial [Porospora cf. gigantea B]|uniref:uncharacterized protein n=1 Tax=Porospora cf. gigantea B TaxID=2853592 RepID=UPI0035719762
MHESKMDIGEALLQLSGQIIEDRIMQELRDLPKFDGSRYNISGHLDQFETICAPIKSSERKLRLLKMTFNGVAKEHFTTLEAQGYDEAKQHMQQQFAQDIYEAQRNFFGMKMRQGQTYSEWGYAVRRQARRADISDKIAIEHMLRGLHNANEQLLLKFIDIQTLEQAVDLMADVDRVMRPFQRRRGNNRQQYDRRNDRKDFDYQTRGQMKEHVYDRRTSKGPATSVNAMPIMDRSRCYLCNSTDHRARGCPSRCKDCDHHVHTTETCFKKNRTVHKIGTTQTGLPAHDDRIQVGQTSVPAYYDLMAYRTIIPTKVIKQENIQAQSIERINTITSDGKLTITEPITMDFQRAGRSYTSSFGASDGLDYALIGRDLIYSVGNKIMFRDEAINRQEAKKKIGTEIK